MAKLFNLEGKKKQIQAYSQDYYANGDTDVEDSPFDALIEDVRDADPNDPLVNQIGWGYDVEKDTTPGEKVKHKYGIVGSLSKYHTVEEIQKWVGIADKIKAEVTSIILDVSAKLDGLSCAAYYRAGQLSMALTRGDGVTGVDITEKFKKILPAYNISDKKFYGAIRGELVMSIAQFNQFKLKHPDAKNPRNSAVGLIGKAGLEELEYITFVPYTVIGIEYESREDIFHDIPGMRNFIHENFATMVPYTTVEIGTECSLDDLKVYFDEWIKIYPIDGLVLTRGAMTMPLQNMPAMSVEYDAKSLKFQSEVANSTVTEVEWNLGKSGHIVPRVHTVPVELAGSTVQYATGFNAMFVKENGIGVGGVVEVTKRGEIIPYINRVVEPVDAVIPTVCPVCGHAVEWTPNKVHIICPNENCPGLKNSDIRIWTMTLAPVYGLGWSLISKFCEQLEVKTVEELMNLTYSDLTKLPIGAQTYMFINMVNQLQTGKFSLVSAIEALNIPRFGGKTAQRLAEHPDVVRLMLNTDHVGRMGREINLGDANIDSLENNMDKFYRLELIKDRIIFETAPKPKSKGKVAITGVLSVARDKFEDELRDAGYEPGGLTKHSLYLITNTPDSSTTKNTSADAWGIQKITEDEFRRKYL